MKRNPVAWAALIVASAALFSSAGFLRQMPAAPKVTEEGQRTAKALSQAFGAVAEFARPSVVQISVQKKMPRGSTCLPACAGSSSQPARQPGQPRRSRPGPGRNAEEVLQSGIRPPEGAVRQPEPTGSARVSSTTITATS